MVENATANAEKYFKENAKGWYATTNCQASNGPKSYIIIMFKLSSWYRIAIVLPETDWSYESEYAQLQEDFSELSSKARADEIKKMTKALEKQVENDLSEPVSMALNNPSSDMWHKILSTYRTAKEHGQDTLVKKAKSKCKGSELESTWFNLLMSCYSRLQLF